MSTASHVGKITSGAKLDSNAVCALKTRVTRVLPALGDTLICDAM